MLLNSSNQRSADYKSTSCLGTYVPFFNTFQDIIEAAKIKAKHPLSYADCFVIQTSLREKAPLITGDLEFKKAQAAPLNFTEHDFHRRRLNARQKKALADLRFHRVPFKTQRH